MKILRTYPKVEGEKPITVEGMLYCPVCGFGPWEESIVSCDICPCCFTEYGFDDTEARQKEWIKKPWFEKQEYMPSDWDPRKQLANAIQGWDMWKRFYDNE